MVVALLMLLLLLLLRKQGNQRKHPEVCLHHVLVTYNSHNFISLGKTSTVIMMRKKYLYSDVPVPRRTLYRHRMKERLRAASQNSDPKDQSGAQQSGKTIPFQAAENTTPHHNVASEDCLTLGKKLVRSDSGVAALSSSESKIEAATSTAFEKGDFSAASDNTASNDGEDSCLEMEKQSVPVDMDLQEDFDSNSAPGEEDSDDPLLNTCLSESTSTTVGDALLMCLALGLRHSLSWAAIVDILEMINHLFNRETIKATRYFFTKYMEAGQGNTTYHVYCPYCERYLGTKQELIDKLLLACVCGTEIKDIQEASTYFLSLSMGQQIKELLRDKVFVSALNYRFTREKLDINAYEDIFDGELYRSLSGPGEVLGEPYNLSYTFNTDGFPVGDKSGKQTCWPIFVQINELPPQKRSKYMILAGIFVGEKDPNTLIFMHSFFEEANALSTAGIDWSLNGKPINSKVIPLCVCVDSPTRAKLLNISQFNRRYGCTLCHCKAERFEYGLRYTIPQSGLKERTHNKILENASQAHKSKEKDRNKCKRFQGVKGVAPIHILKYIDLVRGVRPEIMHNKLLGNASDHTFLLHDGVGQPYYIGSDLRLNAINSRLLSIRPPSSIMRPPRSLQYLRLWKATEWRSWALFYGVVCLQGLIPDEYVAHFSILSSSLHVLLQKSITGEDLQKAHTSILRYVLTYQDLFGKKAMVFNVHLLLHTKRDIECLGPAWTNTAFAFEGANKTLRQFKKSTNNIAEDIAREYLTFKSLPLLSEKYASSDHAMKFCEKLSGRPLKSFQQIGKASLLGSGHSCILNPEEFESLKNSAFPAHRKMFAYGKMVYKGIRYTTNAYSQSHKHDDSFVSLRNGVRGTILKICFIEGNEHAIIFVRELILDNIPLFQDDCVKHSPIKRIQTEGRLLVVGPEEIVAQCVAMFLDSGNFICEIPYGCYSDS